MVNRTVELKYRLNNPVGHGFTASTKGRMVEIAVHEGQSSFMTIQRDALDTLIAGLQELATAMDTEAGAPVKEVMEEEEPTLVLYRNEKGRLVTGIKPVKGVMESAEGSGHRLLDFARSVAEHKRPVYIEVFGDGSGSVYPKSSMLRLDLGIGEGLLDFEPGFVIE
jgi:hypothetical protein